MSKRTKWIIASVVLLITTIVLVILQKRYLDKAPIIETNGSYDVYVGSSVSIDQLAIFKNTVSKKILPEILELEGTSGAEVSSDGQTLYIGNYLNDFSVIVQAVGENGAVKEKKIRISIFVD